MPEASSHRRDPMDPGVLDLIEEDTEPPSDTIEGWLMCLRRCHQRPGSQPVPRPCRRAPAGGASTLRALANELLDSIGAIEIRLENTPVPAKKRAPSRSAAHRPGRRHGQTNPGARTEASDDSGGGGDDNNNNGDAEEEDGTRTGATTRTAAHTVSLGASSAEEIKAPKRREAITSALGSVLRGALRRVNEFVSTTARRAR